MSTVIVITDTSVLINFLVLDQAALLARLPDHRFVVTEHVRAEITDHYQDQLQRLEAAFTAGILEEIRVTDLPEVQLFAQLTATGLGIGECSAIAVAAHRQLTLAIDDKRAVKKLKTVGLQLTLHSTETIVVLLIQHALLTVQEADAMKQEWELHHRFRLPFGSFAERLSSPPSATVGLHALPAKLCSPALLILPRRQGPLSPAAFAAAWPAAKTPP